MSNAPGSGSDPISQAARSIDVKERSTAPSSAQNPTQMEEPHIGRVLANRYKLFELIGQGAMGQVYGARDQTLGVQVAVKVLNHTLINEVMRDRFEQEAKVSAALAQDLNIHIIRVTDYGIDENTVPFFVMEYLRGRSLNEIIREKPLTVPRFLSFCRQICLGLHRAHQGIEVDGVSYPVIHRDIKPSNIFITPDNTLGELVKILDFGIAKTLQEENAQTKCFMGTLAYSSPEQMEGRVLDHRSDIYSLGIMLFQMLTGKLPLHAETRTFGGWYNAHHKKPPRSMRAANPKIKPVPKLLEALVMSCLEKDPNNRPQSVSTIIEELTPLSERFGRAGEISRRIQGVLDKFPVQTPSDSAPTQIGPTPGSQTKNPSPRTEPLLSPDDICRQSTWPANMPVADISFSHILKTPKQSLPTLWVMLPQDTINTLEWAIPYNKFMFAEAPHPTLLWLTVLHTDKTGPKWLPCYLDLKSSTGMAIAELLKQSKEYRILFFTKEEPHRCVRVETLSISEPSPHLENAQAKKLNEFILLGQMAPASTTNLSKLAKQLLKTELEKLKPGIAQKLEAII